MDIEKIEYGIFDDMSWKETAFKDGGFKTWLGGHESFTSTDKYRGKSSVSWGKPAIYLANENPLATLKGANNQKWFIDNTVIIYLGENNGLDRNNAISSEIR